MTRKLLLTIALGTSLAVIAAGTATSVTIDLGNGTKVQVPTDSSLPQCTDLTDNDGDGARDLADRDCSGPLDPSEFTPAGGGSDGSGGGTTGGGGGGGGTGGGDNTLGPGVGGKRK